MGQSLQFTLSPTNGRVTPGIAQNGVRATRYAYGSDQRVTQSGLENGEAVDYFWYGANQTSITNQYGQTAVYNTSQVGGELPSVSRNGLHR